MRRWTSGWQRSARPTCLLLRPPLTPRLISPHICPSQSTPYCTRLHLIPWFFVREHVARRPVIGRPGQQGMDADVLINNTQPGWSNHNTQGDKNTVLLVHRRISEKWLWGNQTEVKTLSSLQLYQLYHLYPALSSLSSSISSIQLYPALSSSIQLPFRAAAPHVCVLPVGREEERRRWTGKACDESQSLTPLESARWADSSFVAVRLWDVCETPPDDDPRTSPSISKGPVAAAGTDSHPQPSPLFRYGDALLGVALSASAWGSLTEQSPPSTTRSPRGTRRGHPHTLSSCFYCYRFLR